MTIASDGSEEPRLLLEKHEPLRTDVLARRHADRVRGRSLRLHPHDPSGERHGTDVFVFIHAPTPPFDAVGHIRGIEWSPDGSLIAVDLRSLADNEKGRHLHRPPRRD